MYPHYHLHHPPRAIPAVDVSRRRPPTPPSSATTAIVTITGLVVTWCRLPPPSSSPLSSTAAASNPTNDGVPTASPHPPPPPAIPPRRCCALSALSITNHPWRRHGLACSVDALPPGPTRQVPLPHAPLVGIRAHCTSAAVATAAMPRSPLRRSAVDPPSLLGPLPPVGQR